MTTPIVTSTTDSQINNNIMAAGSRDRPPMLAPGRYSQWQSCFLRYIDTRPNGDALRKCLLEGPYQPTTVTIPAVPAIGDNPAIPKRTAVETILNMSPENKEHYQAEKEAIHLLLTGIGDDIYSTVDACKTAHEMWIAIERLQQGESLNIQDVKTNLFWEFRKFTSHDGESMEYYYSQFYKMMNEMIRNNLTVATMQVNVQFLQQLQPEWSRFVTIVKQQQDLDTVSYHKLFDVLKQYQKEVNEIRAERIAKNANPLALVASAQQYPDSYYQAPKSHKSIAQPSKQSSLTRSSAPTKFKGKEIAKPITPPSESASEEDSDPEQAQRDKDMQKNLALIAKYFKISKYFKKIYKPTNNNLKTSSNSRNKNVDTTPRCACKQAEKGVPLQAEQYDWLADTDEEIDEQELEAHYSYMEKIQEVPTTDLGTDSEPLEQVQYDTGYNVFANEIQHSKQFESISNTCVVETDDNNVIPDSPDMCDNDIQNDQNDVVCDDERVALANLIANLIAYLKLDVDENKKIQKHTSVLSWKPYQGGSSKLNLPDHRYKRRCCSLTPAESDSLPHAYTQTTKTYYRHQESRIKKDQVLKTKTSANFDKQDLPLRYQVYQGRLLASFQDDAKYEYFGQDTRSQNGKDDQD
ncbi:hypothetical protein Tco_1112891 [Tanacetum coccineum]|uniref:Gag-Pol polyprotein n=1 Tax=Tanacetum coccineum TaxID=301880 RepID=A0ABQ5ITM7_9ASTR